MGHHPTGDRRPAAVPLSRSHNTHEWHMTTNCYITPQELEELYDLSKVKKKDM